MEMADASDPSSFFVPTTMLKPIPLPTRRRQGANDFAVLLQGFIELLDGRLKFGELELGLEHEQIFPFLDALLEPVLLILGEDLQNTAVEVDLLGDRPCRPNGRFCVQYAVNALEGGRNVFKGFDRFPPAAPACRAAPRSPVQRQGHSG